MTAPRKEKHLRITFFTVDYSKLWWISIDDSNPLQMKHFSNCIFKLFH
ncbi:hypothetical protein CoNPh17_CDS0158 [Staphylococcus phage S-CoN_Ph17]|nr:hypothetical protein CoNPh17_CDS0158 [Staphylococcus phage S-CoN_Ph17]